MIWQRSRGPEGTDPAAVFSVVKAMGLPETRALSVLDLCAVLDFGVADGRKLAPDHPDYANEKAANRPERYCQPLEIARQAADMITVDGVESPSPAEVDAVALRLYERPAIACPVFLEHSLSLAVARDLVAKLSDEARHA